MKTLTLAFSMATWLFAANTHAATYDAIADFQTLSNPSGVWSYGYTHEGGDNYVMTLFDTVSDSIWTKAGYVSLNTPQIWKNTGTYALHNVLPGQLSLHPGPQPYGDDTILRFTAPSDGAYSVTGQFFAGDGGSVSGSIVLDSQLTHPLQYFADTTDQSVFAPLSLGMKAGDTLDFVVGNNGNYLYGSTPISVVITTVPEPETCAMMLAGLALLAGIARRRRQEYADGPMAG
jgi:hypothetical protein